MPISGDCLLQCPQYKRGETINSPFENLQDAIKTKRDLDITALVQIVRSGEYLGINESIVWGCGNSAFANLVAAYTMEPLDRAQAIRELPDQHRSAEELAYADRLNNIDEFSSESTFWKVFNDFAGFRGLGQLTYLSYVISYAFLAGYSECANQLLERLIESNYANPTELSIIGYYVSAFLSEDYEIETTVLKSISSKLEGLEGSGAVYGPLAMIYVHQKRYGEALKVAKRSVNIEWLNLYSIGVMRHASSKLRWTIAMFESTQIYFARTRCQCCAVLFGARMSKLTLLSQ